ncbi:MAG: methyltransferase RsmF C-terminal domain-like protein [Bacteroidia bacterium]
MKVPAQIITELSTNFKIDVAAFEEAHNKTVPVSVRLNPLKPACDFPFENKVLWSENAYYLKERPVFTNDPLFHAGCYYVQEASSMFVEQAIKQTIDLTQQIMALDACAAPGGKSTLAASLLNEKSLLVSNEVISTRVPSLVHNMAKWGTANSIVSNNDPKDFSRLPEFFDLMIVDAPCSGSGLFRKQEDAIEHWSEENVNHCSLRQQRILHDLLPSLKENGVLIYSTCSYSKEENENICDYLCSTFSLESIRIKTGKEWGITETVSEKKAYGYRFFPHLAEGEGFFLACFRKAGDNRAVVRSKNKIFDKLTKEETNAVRQFLKADDLEFISHNGEIIGFHTEVSSHVKSILAALKIKKMPLPTGQLKGKDFVPHPYTAYHTILSENINKADVDAEIALRYLRKQDLVLQENTKGFTLLTFKGYGLGWFKNLGNRINNYYPAEWRILREGFS